MEIVKMELQSPNVLLAVVLDVERTAFQPIKRVQHRDISGTAVSYHVNI